MAKGVVDVVNRRRSPEETEHRLEPPAKTPEAREQQLVAAAVDLAEKQLRDGSASAQVITHYLKLGSSREKLEQQRLEYENRLTQQKIDSMQSQQKIEEMYVEAMKAFSSYKGLDDGYVDAEYDDDDPEL